MTSSDDAAVTARRDEIAEAALRIIDRDGLRALTQRAVDAELGLQPGSTSYYARTERQLVQLVVRRLAGRTAADVTPGPDAEPPRDVDTATAALVAAVAAIGARAADVRARFALATDLVTSDPELHGHITHRAPVRALMLERAELVLGGIGVPDAADHAADLVALLNGLLFDRLAGPGVEPAHRARVEHVVRAYLTGLLAR
jgi:AcrR family transcriptional regulator